MLAEIDPRTFQSQVLTEQSSLASAQARLQSAQADLINQEANLVQVQANLKVAQVANENAALLYERSQAIAGKRACPPPTTTMSPEPMRNPLPQRSRRLRRP